MQMITQSPDVRDPQHALTWSRRLALCPFWCLDAKGGESLGDLRRCVASVSLPCAFVVCYLVLCLDLVLCLVLCSVRL